MERTESSGNATEVSRGGVLCPHSTLPEDLSPPGAMQCVQADRADIGWRRRGRTGNFRASKKPKGIKHGERGRRPGAGRKPKSLVSHVLSGPSRTDWHGDQGATAAAFLAMPAPASARDWRPSDAELKALWPLDARPASSDPRRRRPARADLRVPSCAGEARCPMVSPEGLAPECERAIRSY